MPALSHDAFRAATYSLSSVATSGNDSDQRRNNLAVPRLNAIFYKDQPIPGVGVGDRYRLLQPAVLLDAAIDAARTLSVPSSRISTSISADGAISSIELLAIESIPSPDASPLSLRLRLIDRIGSGSLSVDFVVGRLVCSNGLIIGRDTFSRRFRHTASIRSLPAFLADAATSLSSTIPALTADFARLNAIPLPTPSQRHAYYSRILPPPTPPAAEAESRAIAAYDRAVVRHSDILTSIDDILLAEMQTLSITTPTLWLAYNAFTNWQQHHYTPRVSPATFSREDAFLDHNSTTSRRITAALPAALAHAASLESA